MMVSTASLAEERLRAGKFVVAPMFEQSLRRPGHAPIGRVAQPAPAIEIAANFVDQGVVGIGLQVERRLSGRRLLP
jgi:hypothetical protein